MTRRERTEQKVRLLFHSPAAGDEGTDGEFMQLLQGHIFGDLCWTGSLDDRMRELVTVTVLSTLGTLPSLNAGCTPVEIREAVYECAPFIGFPKTLNAIGAMNEVFTAQGIALPLPKQGGDPAERYGRGLAAQQPLYGEEIKERFAWLPAPFAEAVPRALTEFCFGDYLSRGGLDTRERALKAGSNSEEIVCALVHAGAYMGMPRLFNALDACKEVLK